MAQFDVTITFNIEIEVEPPIHMIDIDALEEKLQQAAIWGWGGPDSEDPDLRISAKDGDFELIGMREPTITVEGQ